MTCHVCYPGKKDQNGRLKIFQFGISIMGTVTTHNGLQKTITQYATHITNLHQTHEQKCVCDTLREPIRENTDIADVLCQSFNQRWQITLAHSPPIACRQHVTIAICFLLQILGPHLGLKVENLKTHGTWWKHEKDVRNIKRRFASWLLWHKIAVEKKLLVQCSFDIERCRWTTIHLINYCDFTNFRCSF